MRAVRWAVWRSSTTDARRRIPTGVINEALAAARGKDLDRQQRVNARIIEDMQDGVVVVNMDGIVRHVNPRAEEWLGATLRSFFGVR